MVIEGAETKPPRVAAKGDKMDYSRHVSTKKTPQALPIPGSTQVRNSAGGFVWKVDDWTRLERFLILGSEGGTYYVGEKTLTVENASAVMRCIDSDGERVVRKIVEISDAGRAPKNDPAIFALAMAAKRGRLPTRRAAYLALPKVCRIGTHLFHFAKYVEAFGGWGRGTRRAVANWYNLREAGSLAYQMVKYQNRDGWKTGDLLRLSHPKPATETHDLLYKWALKGGEALEGVKRKGSSLDLVLAFEEIKAYADKPRKAIKLIEEFDLPRECVPTELLNNPDVWEALLVKMKPEAMIRNLGKMTAVGLIGPMSSGLKEVVTKLSIDKNLIDARLHPVKILGALLTYKQGHGVKGSLSWTPQGKICDALDAAFYKAFGAVKPTGKRTLLALDVSASMDGGQIAGIPGLTPRIGSAAMSLITAAVEPDHAFVAFTSNGRGWNFRENTAIQTLEISHRQRLDDVVRTMSNIPFGGTDCALPMIWAKEQKLAVDTFCIYTDNETWQGNIHASQALQDYRRSTGINAKLCVVGMTATEFTIADPDDSGMLDVCGFDTATPEVISNFSEG